MTWHRNGPALKLTACVSEGITGCEHSAWLSLSSDLAVFIRLFRCAALLLVRSSLDFRQNHIPRQTHRIQQQVHSSEAVSFFWIFFEFGFPAEVSSLSRNRPNEVWRPLGGFSFFETAVDLPRRSGELTSTLFLSLNVFHTTCMTQLTS